MKKFLTMLLTVILAVSSLGLFTACGDENEYKGIQKIENLADIKVGFIYLHDENSTYDKNFMDAAKAVVDELGVQYVQATNIPEGNACYEKAVQFAEDGCDIIFADSFGHEEYMLKAANEYPNVQFCHATGTMAHTEKRGNFQNAFASIYEGRYLAGVAAGLKLIELYGEDITADEAKVGYVGAFPYAEVVSGYTSWFLGLRSIVANATMQVKYTQSWYDFEKEKTAAQALIDAGCTLISQHADSMGAPEACESANIPNVCYNISTQATCENTYIIASKINWAPYFRYMINCVNKGEEIADDWTGTIANGAVQVLEIGQAAAEGTQTKLDEVKANFANGSLKVFDLSKFTVGGNALADDYKANVDNDVNFKADTVVIKTTEGGVKYFAESEFRSAPYFELRIDGITELD